MKPHPRRNTAPTLRPLALAIAALCLAPLALAAGPAALPGGLQVVQGQATLATAGNRLTVTNSANAVLNWQQFSIGADNAVHFAQPGASSKVLNRVVGSDPSAILGRLSSNGQVWLLNPNGVLFGAGARVDVAALVASTLRLGDADWAAGRLNLAGSADGAFGSTASVVNQGTLRTVNGGRVLLIGSGSVRNEGLIEAPDGQVLLAAGRSVELVDTGLPNLSVKVSAPQGEAVNLGTLLAGSGRIDLQAALVNQQGIVRADSLASGRGGEVVLTAGNGVELGAGSQTSANGAAGGRVSVDGGSGATLVSGSLSATGRSGAGGGITLLGRQVGLLDGSLVDASGAAGGGAVRVGGGLQGRDAAYRNAEAVYMGPGAAIAADATASGDGGLVVLWSDQATRVYGSLSARGGPFGGNGGFIETSGHWLDARPTSVRATAPAGRAGQWLIDPDDILITDGASDSFISDTDPGVNYNFSSNLPGGPSSPSQATLSTATIVTALNAGNNVTVTTGGAGSGSGDITLSEATIDPAPGAPVSLTLNALRNITVDFGEIRSTNTQPLTLNLVAGHQGGGGAIKLDRLIVDTKGGNLYIGGNSSPCSACDPLTAPKGAVASNGNALLNGIELIDSSLSAGGGTVTLAGHSLVDSAATQGVLMRGGAVSGRVIDITGSVTSSGNVLRTGVAIQDGGNATDPGASVTASERLTISGSVSSTSFHVFGSRPTGVQVQGQSRLEVGVTGGPAGAQMTIQGSVRDEEPPSLGSLRQAVSLSGATRLVGLGGAGIDILSTDLSTTTLGMGVYGLDAAGSQAGFIDASQASHLKLQATAAQLSLFGDVKAPEGGPLSLLANGVLQVPNATFSGNPGQVTLRGSAIEIGALGSAVQMAFGADTAVAVQTFSFKLGSAPGSNPNPPSVDLSAGGPISIRTDSVALAGTGRLASTATGDAIVFQGYSRAPNVSRFVNSAGGAALATPNGRWLVYVQDSGSSAGTFQPSTLPFDFRQYAAVAGSAVPAQSGGNGFLFSSAPLLSLSASLPLSRVYDGTTLWDPATMGGSVTGMKTDEQWVGTLAFADANVGQSKPLQLVPRSIGGVGAAVTTTGGQPVYGYQPDPSATVASITPRPLTLAGVVVADKVYDGSMAATVTRWSLSNGVQGDQVDVGSGSGQFSSADAGVAKPVLATAAGLSGADAGNYSLVAASRQASASISPAPLLYVADPAVSLAGQPLPPLSGTVTGFVAGETLANATTGTLRFDTPATPNAAPGRYAIDGSGLAAANYSFAQAPGNAAALTLQAPQRDEPPTNPYVTQQAVVTVLPVPPATSPASGRTLDAMPALLATGGASPAFASLDLDSLSPAALAGVLAARSEYKRALFAPALALLEQDPGLADAPPCTSPQQAETGQCLMTGPLVAAPGPAGTTGETAGAAPAAPGPAPAPAPSAAPAPAPAAAAAARVMPPPRPVVDLPKRRGVTSATLPQIQRKVALLIGVDQYNDVRIPRLSNAVNDARAVATALETELGYETVVLPNANRSGIFRALNQLASQVGPADSVIVYYAGHGESSEKSGLGYWQPADADPARPDSWISNADIDRLIRQLPASQVAVISDSCFSGSMVAGPRIRGAVGAQDPGALLQRRAVVVMTSGGNEPVFDSGKNGHSPFAWNLMQSLQKVSSWKAGSSLFEQVRFAVARQLPQRPQYAAAPNAGHEAGADYLFEQRQLEGVVK